MKVFVFSDGALTVSGKENMEVAEGIPNIKSEKGKGDPVKDCTKMEFYAMIYPQNFVEEEEKGS